MPARFCGFGSTPNCGSALEVCRLFAKQTGFNWAGGLAMGGGGIIEGLPLAEIGGRVRNQRKALELAANALSQGDPIPEEALILMSKLVIPRRFYLWMANRSWKGEAKKNGAENKLYDQPCKERCL